MLKVDLRELARGAVDTQGQIAGSDPLFAGMELVPAEPVRVTGRLQGAGPDQWYWQATLATRMAGECRLCLAPVSTPVEAHVSALFSREPGAADDPDTYAVADDATAIDLSPAVRDELFLTAPRYLQCRDDCRGLCPSCGKDLNAGPCGCPPATDERWRPLAALKDKLRE